MMGHKRQKRHQGKTRLITGPILVSFVSFVLIQLCALPVRAELAFFSNGRTLPIKGHRVDGDSLVLTLRSGGEIVCDTNAIARFAPDEVPYPEPEPVTPAAAETPAPL